MPTQVNLTSCNRAVASRSVEARQAPFYPTDPNIWQERAAGHGVLSPKFVDWPQHGHDFQEHAQPPSNRFTENRVSEGNDTSGENRLDSG